MGWKGWGLVPEIHHWLYPLPHSPLCLQQQTGPSFNRQRQTTKQLQQCLLFDILGMEYQGCSGPSHPISPGTQSSLSNICFHHDRLFGLDNSMAMDGHGDTFVLVSAAQGLVRLGFTSERQLRQKWAI